MIYLDEKYLALASARLEGFRRVDRRTHVFRCPACGDSTQKRSRHCYAFTVEDGLRVFCHRCSWSTNIIGLLRRLDEELVREYLMEKFDRKERPPATDWEALERMASSAERPVAPPRDPLGDLVPLSEAAPDNDSLSFARRRLLPESLLPRLFHAEDFGGWAATVAPERFEGKGRPEPRFVIPFEWMGRLSGFQGRSHGEAGLRYITVALDPTVPFLYGIDRVVPGEPVVAVEGPIDAMFLRNGVASAGGSISREVAKSGLQKQATVVAYDNEPRSRETVGKMRRALNEGFPVFVWPVSCPHKDINDWVLSGASPELIMETIRERTLTGLSAELAISDWKRCEA